MTFIAGWVRAALTTATTSAVGTTRSVSMPSEPNTVATPA